MFTPSFCNFVKTVVNVLGSTFGHQLGQKFYNPSVLNSPIADFSLRALLFLFMPVALQQFTNDQIVPFAIASAANPATSGSAHLVICKLLQLSLLKLTQKVVEAVNETRDLVILIEYADAMTDFDLTETCLEANVVAEQRRRILDRLPIVEKHGYSFLVIESIQLSGAIDRTYDPIIELIGRMKPTSAARDMERFPHTFTSMRVFIMLKYMLRWEFAAAIVKNLKKMLSATVYSEDGECHFEIRPCDYALSLAEIALPRLLAFGFQDLAEELLSAMEPVLIADSAPLHWLSKFTSHYRHLLTPTLCDLLARILAALPFASELFVREDFREVSNILVNRDVVLIQSPDVIIREYQSPYMHAHVFAVCAQAISRDSDDAIANALASPMFDMGNIWVQRDNACILLGKIAASLSVDIGYKYFEILIGHRCCEMSLNSGHSYILNIGTRLLKKIAVSSKQLVDGDDAKLDYYVRLLKPGFQKLDGAPEEACTMVCGLLESVSEKTPRKLQETIVDIAGLLYWELKFTDGGDRLKSAGEHLDMDLKLVLACSFESCLAT
jgi:hypothetical protein